MALKRYHINPESGEVGLCVARRRCRFGGDAVHYPSDVDARMAYERRMERAQLKGAQRTPEGKVEALPEGIVKGSQFEVQPGSYLLGDPYLTIGLQDQKGWNNIVESVAEQFGWENDLVDPANEQQIAVGALYDGRPVLALKSYHGGGLHWSLGPTRRIPSDTGLVGFVSLDTLSDIGMDVNSAEAKKFGMRVDLDKPTTVWRDPNGIIVVGGRLLVCHNDLIQSHWFNSLDRADGINDAVATSETYAFLTERARLWIEDPALAAQ